MTDTILRGRKEISAYAKTPISTLKYYEKHGTGPKTWRIGRMVMAYVSDVDQWFRENYEASAQVKSN